MSFGEALHFENRKRGLHVTVVAPGATDTPMLGANTLNRLKLLNDMNLPLMMPEVLVKGAIKAITKNDAVYVPGWRLNLMLFARRFVRREVNVRFWAYIMGRYLRMVYDPLESTKNYIQRSREKNTSEV